MRNAPHWVGRVYKTPINPRTLRGAVQTVPSTWGTFKQAVDSIGKTAHYKDGDVAAEGIVDGIGFMLSNGWAGVDLDTVLDPRTGEIAPDAEKIIEDFASYTEISLSGYGLHIFIHAPVSTPLEGNKYPLADNGVVRFGSDGKAKEPEVEMYTHSRFLTVTGNRFTDIATVEERAEMLSALNAEYAQKKAAATPKASANHGSSTPLSLDCENILTVARRKPEFVRLFDYGDTSDLDNDDSRADLKLCGLLAFYTGRDAEKIDTLFRSSKLMRPKWDDKRGNTTYGARTIQKAIDNCQHVFNPNEYWLEQHPRANIKTDAADEADNGNPLERDEKPITSDNAESAASGSGVASPEDTEGKSKRPPFTLDAFREWLKQRGYFLGLDAVSHKVIIKGFDSIVRAEHVPAYIDSPLRAEFTQVSFERIRLYMDAIVSENEINPLLDEIRATKWDGIDRLEEMYNILQIDEDDALSRTAIRKCLMQALAMLQNDFSKADSHEHCYQSDFVLVLQGGQGIGKTSFLRHLVPRAYWGEIEGFNPQNKDNVIESLSKWICELGEIGKTTRRDTDGLKQFLTRAVDVYRTPYARSAAEYPRRTVFFGTVNDATFLSDVTGNRRFVVVPLKDTLRIDYETQTARFDSMQLWAQINTILSQMESGGIPISSCFRLSRDELNNASERNKIFERPLPGEEEIRDILATDYDGCSAERYTVRFVAMTATEFKAEHEELRRYTVQQIGCVLRKLGYAAVKTKGGRMYKLPSRTYKGVSYGN